MKNLAHEFLDIEAEDFEVPQGCYDTLEDILRKARKKINPRSRPKKVLSRIGKILKGYGFRYKRTNLLSQGLQTKWIDCKHYSLLYYSIAEELGLPLNIVAAPHHIFVRWCNKDTLNWETTSAKELNEEEYKRWIHKTAISNGIYLKGLTRKETRAIAFYARANAKYKKKDLEGALADCDIAIGLNPIHSETYGNRAAIKIKMGYLKGAIKDCDKAIELNPGSFGSAEAYHNRAIARRQIGDFKGAKRDEEVYKRAILLRVIQAF